MAVSWMLIQAPRRHQPPEPPGARQATVRPVARIALRAAVRSSVPAKLQVATTVRMEQPLPPVVRRLAQVAAPLVAPVRTRQPVRMQ